MENHIMKSTMKIKFASIDEFCLNTKNPTGFLRGFYKDGWSFEKLVGNEETGYFVHMSKPVKNF